MAGYGRYSQHAARLYMPDPTSHIRFSSIFPKKAQIILCKTNPDLIWMVWSRFGQTPLVWKQAGVQESSGLVSGRTQLALPVSRFQTWFRSSTGVPDNTVQNQPRSSLVLADCVRFWPNGSSPEASQCARNIRPASGQCFPLIRTGCESDPDCLWVCLPPVWNLRAVIWCPCPISCCFST